MHKPRSRFNLKVRESRWGPHRLRYLTQDELDEWVARINAIVERVQDKAAPAPDPVWDRVMAGLG